MKKLLIITALSLMLFRCSHSSSTIECPCIVISSEVHNSNYLITVQGKDNENISRLDGLPYATFQLQSATQYNIGDTLKFVKQ